MSRYDVFGKEFDALMRRNVRITGALFWLLFVLWVGFPLGLMLFGRELAEDALAAFFAMGIPMAMLGIAILVGRRKTKQDYHNTLSIEPDGITLYTADGKLWKRFLFSQCRAEMMRVDFVNYTEHNYRRAITTFECLVFYRDAESISSAINQTTGLPAMWLLHNDPGACVIHDRRTIKAIRQQCAQFIEKQLGNVSSVPLSGARVNDSEQLRSSFGNQYALLKDGLAVKSYAFLCFVVVAAVMAFAALLCWVLFLTGVVEELVPLIASFIVCAFAPLLFQAYSERQKQRTAVVDEEGVSVYSPGGKLLRTFRFAQVRGIRRYYWLEGGKQYGQHERECLILYTSAHLPATETFSALWKNEDVLVTCNPALIELLESCLSPEQILEE
ncbi:MAG: hypothetical protein IJX82_01300 [Clostridia bacterium]|nr:hypothetical protein [Clostridia bacterium]